MPVSRTDLVINPIHMASFFPQIHSMIPGRNQTRTVSQAWNEVRLWTRIQSGLPLKTSMKFPFKNTLLTQITAI